MIKESMHTVSKEPLAGNGSVNRRFGTASTTDMMGRHLCPVDNVMTNMPKISVMKNENLHWVDKVFIIFQVDRKVLRSEVTYISIARFVIRFNQIINDKHYAANEVTRFTIVRAHEETFGL